MIATEACRAAANGAEFIARVLEETGLALEIVSQEAEARLAVAGCASLVDPTASGVILFDIGGGSSELVWIDLAPRRTPPAHGRPRALVDVAAGGRGQRQRAARRTVTSRRRPSRPWSTRSRRCSPRFRKATTLDRAVAEGRVHMLGTSGTVTTLAGIHLELPRYDRRRVDGTWLTGQRVDELIDLLVGMDYAARVANPCIGEDRADLVLAGCAILAAFRRRWRCDRMRVADRGLREGMLVELMAEDGVWRTRGPSRRTDAARG